MSTRLMRALAFAVLWSLMVSVPDTAAALTRSVVKVRFAFADKHPYSSGFTENDRAWIADQVAPCVATLLSTKLRYLDFKIDIGEHELLIELGDKIPTPRPNTMREVGFWIAADEEVTREKHQLYVRYRPANEFHKTLPSKEGLAAELEMLLRDFVNQQHTSIVTLLSRNVTVADKALPLSPPEWALPFTHKDLSIENKSQFRIVAHRAADSMVVEKYDLWAIAKGEVAPSDKVAREWHHAVVARSERADPMDPSPLTPDRFGQLVAKNVYVTLYQRPPSKPLNRKLASSCAEGL